MARELAPALILVLVVAGGLVAWRYVIWARGRSRPVVRWRAAAHVAVRG